MPTFSIIIPTYNSERFIAETLDSVRRQTLTDWQMIVVDDGSTDGTASVVGAIADPRILIHRQANTGAAAARQNGVRFVEGEWIVFLDHDDRLAADALARYADAIARFPDAVVHYGERVFIDETGRRYGAKRPKWIAARPEGDVLHACLASSFITTVGQACIRGGSLSAIGGFPNAGGYANDWVLWCLLATVGPFHHVGTGAILEYRRHSGNMGLQVIAAGVRPADIDDLIPSIDFVFGHDRIRSLLTDEQRRRFRRMRESNCFRFKGVSGLRAGSYAFARRCFWAALKRDPASLANIAGLLFALAPPLRPLFARFVG